MHQISLREALEHADVYALKTFIRKEANRSKHLAIKLKLAFIESVTLKGGLNRYAALLAELIREDQHGVVELTKREVKLLAEICNTLLGHSTSHFADKAYTDNYTLLSAQITSLHRYLDKIKIAPTELTSALVSSYDHLLRLTAESLAPELRDKIFDDGIDLLTLSYYSIYHPDKNIVPALLRTQSSDDQLHALRSALQGKMSIAESPDIANWSYWYAIITESLKSKPDVLFCHQVLGTKGVFNTARELKEKGNDTALQLWISSFDDVTNLSGEMAHDWTSWRFDSSLAHGDQNEVIRNGVNLMVDTMSIDIYRILRTHFEPGIINEHLPDSIPDILMAEIHAEEQNWDALTELVADKKDLDILIRFLGKICAHADDAFDVISSVVGHFVTHYAGTSCRDGLIAVILTLENLGHPEMARRLSTEVEAEFPDRFVRSDMRLDISY